MPIEVETVEVSETKENPPMNEWLSNIFKNALKNTPWGSIEGGEQIRSVEVSLTKDELEFLIKTLKTEKNPPEDFETWDSPRVAEWVKKKLSNVIFDPHKCVFCDKHTDIGVGLCPNHYSHHSDISFEGLVQQLPHKRREDENPDPAVARERKYTSQQPWEQAYKKHRKSPVVGYKPKANPPCPNCQSVLEPIKTNPPGALQCSKCKKVYMPEKEEAKCP